MNEQPNPAYMRIKTLFGGLLGEIDSTSTPENVMG
jgi:hypothetical protein